MKLLATSCRNHHSTLTPRTGGFASIPKGNTVGGRSGLELAEVGFGKPSASGKSVGR